MIFQGRIFFSLVMHLRLVIYLAVLCGMDLFVDQVNNEDIAILYSSTESWALSFSPCASKDMKSEIHVHPTQ